MPLSTLSRYDPFRVLHKRIRRTALREPWLIVQYDHITCDLVIWEWPVMRDLHTIGARLTPDQLLQHRQTHAFKAPCCLCSVNPDLGYTETVIVVCKSGEFTGEYVAECALGVCGYMVPLDRMWAKRGLRIKVYPALPSTENVSIVPPVLPVTHSASAIAAYMQLNDFNRMFSYQVLAEQVLEKLLQLDDWNKPGLTEAEFLSLFTRCTHCGLVMTGRVFQQHTQVCAGFNGGNRDTALTVAVIHDIIDLTNDSDDDECPGVIDLTLDE